VTVEIRESALFVMERRAGMAYRHLSKL